MRTIGFVISEKPNERRRAILPCDLARVENVDAVFIQEGYGRPLGIPDSAYTAMGCEVAPMAVVYDCDVICNPKAPEPAERLRFRDGQTLFGWVHAVQGRAIVDFLVDRGMTAIAWEDMYQDGRHTFWRNNEIAGEAAVLHAVNFLGEMPGGMRAALIGRGNCARGAHRTLSQLGVSVTSYDRATVGRLRADLPRYDLVVNAIMWDVFRTGHLLTIGDLDRMKRGAMIVDISCDEGMAIESSRPTSLLNPVYEVRGVLHYVVDHTPALFYKTASREISAVVGDYIDELVRGEPAACLRNATVIEDGRILDERISNFQRRGRTTRPATSVAG